VNRKKVERAQLMLMTEPIHVKEVAFSLGFDDHSYFIRLFKKSTGLTPNDYRQRYGYRK
jgi:YesN/AraC family two-component response regulator